MNDSIEAKSSNEGRIYTGVVERDVRDTNGNVVLRGSNAEFIVRETTDHSLVLDPELLTANGRRDAVSTTDQVVTADQGDRKEGVGANCRTGKYVGGGALVGTIIGAIAGGGKGAAIGALTGAGAGAVGQTVTRGGEVRVPSESVVTFSLDRPIIVSGPDPGYDREGHHYHRYNNDDNSSFRSRSDDHGR